jgi:hypothetical protein
MQQIDLAATAAAVLRQHLFDQIWRPDKSLARIVVP